MHPRFFTHDDYVHGALLLHEILKKLIPNSTNSILFPGSFDDFVLATLLTYLFVSTM